MIIILSINNNNNNIYNMYNNIFKMNPQMMMMKLKLPKDGYIEENKLKSIIIIINYSILIIN